MEFKEIREQFAKDGLPIFSANIVPALAPKKDEGLFESLTTNSGKVLGNSFNEEIKIQGEVFNFITSLALRPHTDQTFVSEGDKFAKHIVSFVFKDGELFNWKNLKEVSVESQRVILKKHWDIVSEVKDRMSNICGFEGSNSNILIYGGCGAGNNHSKKAQSVDTIHTHIIVAPEESHATEIRNGSRLYNQNVWNNYMERIFSLRSLIHKKLERIFQEKEVSMEVSEKNIAPILFSINCKNGLDVLESIRSIHEGTVDLQKKLCKNHGNTALGQFNIPDCSSFVYNIEKNDEKFDYKLRFAPSQSGPAEVFNNKVFKLKK